MTRETSARTIAAFLCVMTIPCAHATAGEPTVDPGVSVQIRGAQAAAAIPGKFDFGPGPVEPGWMRVTPDMDYDDAIGYGFDPGPPPEGVDRGAGDPLGRDLITGTSPFLFSASLPEGNYDVTVIFGDRERGSTNTVKAELRRLMLERVVTRPGEFVTRAFTVNIRTPALPGGGWVVLKERERGVLHWDDKLTLEFSGSSPAVCSVEVAPTTNAITVFLLGDSTVTDQPNEPWNS